MNSRTWTFFICLFCSLLLVQAEIMATGSINKQSSMDSMKDTDKMGKSALSQKGNQEVASRESKIDKEEKHLESESHEAVVYVSNLTQDNVQKSLDILKDIEGIQAMKPDFNENMIHIVYTSGLDFDMVTKKLKEVFQDVKIKEITKIDAKSQSKCDGCPSKTKCEETEKKVTASS